MHDLVIRGGLIVDGGGEPVHCRDAAIEGDRLGPSDGEATGALPGRLLRGPRPAPAV